MKIRDLILDKGFLMLSLFLFIAVLIIVCLSSELINKSSENSRLQSNIKVLTSEVQQFKTKDGKNAAQVKTLTLTTSELKEQNTQLVSELKTMRIKPRDVKNIQQISTEAKYEVQLVKKDTVIYDTIQAIKYTYTDDWITVNAICPANDTCTASIVTRDSLLIVLHCKTRKILFWTWKKYSGQATVKNYNPYSEIVSIKNIDIEK